MKKIGLIGGMSWESSLEYYRLINEKVKTDMGGLHSCRCVMESVDFAEIEYLQHLGDWKTLDRIMIQCAQNLVQAGAEIIILCTNTMHLCSDAIQSAINIPFLHIAEATGSAIQKQNLRKVLLLGTKFTMEKDFYKSLLKQQLEIEVIIPSAADRELVHQVIYQELVLGEINQESKKSFVEIINRAEDTGAEGVILGCTEIPLLINQNDVPIPVFDTTSIHANRAVELALRD